MGSGSSLTDPQPAASADHRDCTKINAESKVVTMILEAAVVAHWKGDALEVLAPGRVGVNAAGRIVFCQHAVGC